MTRRKDTVLVNYDKAKAAGSYLVAVFWVQDGQIFLERKTENFALSDMKPALDMLRINLQEEAGDMI